MLRLWKYNTTTGYWKVVRSVTPETKEDWLRIWQKDDPTGNYVVSTSTPPRAPKSQAKDSASLLSAFVAALLAWYEAHQAQEQVERNQASGYNLLNYRPKPKAL